MSEDELEKMEYEIQEALHDKRKIKQDDNSEKYMVIRAHFHGPETCFKVDKAKYSKDINDYNVKYGSLYYKDEKLDVKQVEHEGDKKISRYNIVGRAPRRFY